MSNNHSIDVLFLSHRHDVKGGAEKALLELIEHVVQQGQKPHVIIGDEGNIIPELNKLKVPHTIVYLPYWAHGEGDSSAFAFASTNPVVSTVPHLVRLVDELKPRICVTNTIVIPWLAYVAAITNTPHIWMVHELGTAGLNLDYAIGEQQTLRTIDLLSDHIIYNSQYTAKYYLPHFTLNKTTSIVYPSGSISAPNKIKDPFDSSSKRLVCVGQIKPQKGQLDAVKAVDTLIRAGHSIQLALIGDVEDESYFKDISRFISQNNLEDAVLLLGYKTNPASYIAISDIVVVCATNESFGRVAVEGMLLKKPIIAARSAGLTEIINDGKTGLFFTPGNTVELSEKIISLVTNPSKMKRLSTRGYTDASTRFTPKKRYEDFDKLLTKKQVPKTALTLLPLAGLTSDYDHLIEILDSHKTSAEHYKQELEVIYNSSSWKVSQQLASTLKLVKKFLNRP